MDDRSGGMYRWGCGNIHVDIANDIRWILKMRYNKYTPMGAVGWHRVKPHFSPSENWGDPDKIDARIVFTLFDIREFTGRKIIVHCGYEQRKNPSWHSHYLAVDFHIDGMHVADQFLVCSRFDQFNGIGIYPNWNNPGIHGDSRTNKLKHRPEARWISVEQGVYIPLTWKNFGML